MEGFSYFIDNTYWKYVDPFKHCTETGEIIHIITLLLDGSLYPFVSGTMPITGDPLEYPEGVLIKGDGDKHCRAFSGVETRARALVYQDARQRCILLGVDVPKKAKDIVEGLQDLQAALIRHKSQAPPEKPVRLKVIEAEYHVTSGTLIRWIRSKKLTTHRKGGLKGTGLHLVMRSDAADHWEKK